MMILKRFTYLLGITCLLAGCGGPKVNHDVSSIYHELQAQTKDETENNYYLEYANQKGTISHQLVKGAGATQIPQSPDVFDAIVNGTEKARFLFENDMVIAFLKLRDTGNNVHALVISKRHVAQLHDLDEAEFQALFAGGEYIAKELNHPDNFHFRINNGSFQGIPHVHLHCKLKGISLFDKLPLQTIDEWHARPTEWRLHKK
jgi:hypothetical protein